MKALRPLTASLMLLTSCLLISNTTLAKTTLKTKTRILFSLQSLYEYECTLVMPLMQL